MNREAHPRRTGPQPLHLATEILGLMSSMAALPLLRNGSLSWDPNLQPLATELMERVAQTTPDAFTEVLRAEAQARFNAFTHGIHLYQKSPPSERLKEPPVVWQSGVEKLLDFGATHENAAEGSPILVVPSLINRGYVLDLTDKLSLLRELAKRGLRPMLMDWCIQARWSAPSPLRTTSLALCKPHLIRCRRFRAATRRSWVIAWAARWRWRWQPETRAK